MERRLSCRLAQKRKLRQLSTLAGEAPPSGMVTCWSDACSTDRFSDPDDVQQHKNDVKTNHKDDEKYTIVDKLDLLKGRKCKISKELDEKSDQISKINDKLCQSRGRKCKIGAKVAQLQVKKCQKNGVRCKSFLDCLELQPVEEKGSQDQSQDAVGSCSQNQSQDARGTRKKLQLNISYKKSRKLGQKTIHKFDSVKDKRIHATKLQNKQETNLSEDLNVESLDVNVPGSKSITGNKSSSFEKLGGEMLDKSSLKVAGKMDKEGNVNSVAKVYIFRDVNKVVHGVRPDEAVVDMFMGVDLNRHGKKRRYDKLMKKLVDGERNLEMDLKEVKTEETEKADISSCVEKMKEKLQVREKKKYEFLINYMRDQWKVDEKSFQDLLPQKVELVQSNVVKQLGMKTEKIVEKRRRGRPRKKAVDGEGSKENLNVENKTIQDERQKKRINKNKKLKSAQTLLSNSLVSNRQPRVDKFRVGIVDRNGSQEFIELNSETVQGVGGCKIEESSLADVVSLPLKLDSSDTGANTSRRSRRRSAAQDASLSNTQQAMDNSRGDPSSGTIKDDGVQTHAENSSKLSEDVLPPTTISLPSISSLEKDYELVSLSSATPPQLGNLYKDHFFIPQSTFDQDGKTSMIIVGPFCLVFDPKPRLLLVSAEEHKKGPTMILRKKVHSPSNTPPRDFRIHKELRRVHHSDKLANQILAGQTGDPALILLDHNYMTPLKFRDNVRRYCKSVAKHSANAKFIDARVEYIMQEDDNFVVTIKGDNMLHQVKKMGNQSLAAMSCDKDGMPVVYSLNQVMTPALIEADLSAKREALVIQSQQTGDHTPVMFPLSSMGDVVMEVLIPPGGTEVPSRIPRTRQAQEQRRTETASRAGAVEQASSMITDLEFVGSNMDSRQAKFIHHKSSSSINIEGSPCCNSQELEAAAGNEKMDQQVVIENAATVDGGSPEGLPCCRLCLRLFSSNYILFSHVRSCHPVCDSRDSMYLDELRARSHLACPICCNPPVFLATRQKLKRHLRINHGVENYMETCNICQAEFHDRQELELHQEMAHHGMFNERRHVNVLQTGHQLNRLRNIVADCLPCSRCDIVFMDRASLLKHTLKVHPELNQFNMCRLCDRLFDSSVALHKHLRKAHELTHSGALKCPFCPAWLSSMELASIHRVTLHTGAVPVHCPFCGSGYQNLHLMYNHVRNQHLQTEVHVCPHCQDSFHTGRTLSEHVKKVHGLSLHIIKESSQSSCAMTYCCPFCSMTFMRTYDLAIHVINDHKEHLLPAQCQLCMQSFVNDVVMKMHMSGAHGVSILEDENLTDVSYVFQQFDDSQSVTVILQDDIDDMYSHSNTPLDSGAQDSSGALMRGHLMSRQDVLRTQETDQYIDLDERETIVYLNGRNQVVTTGEMFDGCSSIDGVHLLSAANDDFNLHGVDYLETLSNDSIAVGADVVADVCVEDVGRPAGQQGGASSNQDLLGLTGQFEIDGVFYELTTQDCSGGHIISVDGTNLRVQTDGISIDGTNVGVHTNGISIDGTNLGILTDGISIDGTDLGIHSDRINIDGVDVGAHTERASIDDTDVGVHADRVTVDDTDLGIHADLGLHTESITIDASDFVHLLGRQV